MVWQLILGKVAVGMASHLGKSAMNMILHQAGMEVPNSGDSSLNVKNELDMLAKQQAQIVSQLDQLEFYVKNDKVFKDVILLCVKLEQDQPIGEEYMNVANALYICVGKPKQFEMEGDGIVDISNLIVKLNNGDQNKIKLQFESWYMYLVHLYSVCLAVAVKRSDTKGQQIIGGNMKTMSDRMIAEYCKRAAYRTLWSATWKSGWILSLVQVYYSSVLKF